MGTVVTSKGQVTIPKPVRERLGITPGTEVEFELTENGDIQLVRAGPKRPLKKSPFAKIRGALKSDMRTDEIMALLRGDA